MSKLLHMAQIAAAIVPTNLATAANNGDWVNLSQYRSVAVVLFKGVGTAGEDPVFTLRQAKDNAGTDAKELKFSRVHTKIGPLSTLGQFTVVEQAEAGTFVDAASAEAEAIIVVEIAAEELDVTNGFSHLQLSVPDVGAGSQIGAGLYILFGSRYSGADMPSALD